MPKAYPYAHSAKSLKVTLASLGAATALLLCPHAAHAGDNDAIRPSAMTVKAATNMGAITAPPTLAPVKPVVLNVPSMAGISMAPSANRNALPDTALAAIAQTMDPGTPGAEQIRRLRMFIAASSEVNRITAGHMTGQLRDATPALMTTEDLLVGRVESRWDPQAVAPSGSFKKPFNRDDRPAGGMELSGVKFATALAAHLDETEPMLTDAERLAVQPAFDTLRAIGNAYAEAHNLDPSAVMRNDNHAFEAAYMAASLKQILFIRNARTDMTPVMGTDDMTTSGLFMSILSRRYVRDDSQSMPEKITRQVACFVDKTKPAFAQQVNASFAFVGWVLGDGGSGRLWKQGNTHKLEYAVKANPSVFHGQHSATGILKSVMHDQFGKLGPLREQISYYVPAMASGAATPAALTLN